MMKVAVVKCDDYAESIDSVARCIDLLGIKLPQGKKVLIKPNLLGHFSVDQCITTHPSLVEALCILLKGNEVFVGDSSGTGADGGTDRSFVTSGIKDIAEKYGARLVNFDKEPLKIVDDDSSVFAKQFRITEFLDSMDYVINVPKIKTHMLTRLTCAIKNCFGCVPGGLKRNAHSKANSEEHFSNFLLDIYQHIKPDLHIVDGVIGIEGDGPGTGGKKKQTGIIAAGTNGYAVDSYVADFIGLKDEVLTNRFARERGYFDGEFLVVGDDVEKVNYKKAHATVVWKMPRFMYSFLTEQFKKTPDAIHDKCVRCGICMRSCPVNAISMKPYPVINKKKCITCYCCHELCPHAAMDLKKPFIGRMIDKVRR